jgi:hypothetical protein
MLNSTAMGRESNLGITRCATRLVSCVSDSGGLIRKELITKALTVAAEP